MPDQPCILVQNGSAPDVFYPGRFDGGPAPTVPTKDCPSPSAQAPGSQMPFWLGSATSAYQVEVGHLLTGAANVLSRVA